MKERINQKLNNNLTISKLEIINQSSTHTGHIENSGSGETHFKIIISAKELEGKSRIKGHRLINDLLKEEFSENGLHALVIKIF